MSKQRDVCESWEEILTHQPDPLPTKSLGLLSAQGPLLPGESGLIPMAVPSCAALKVKQRMPFIIFFNNWFLFLVWKKNLAIIKLGFLFLYIFFSYCQNKLKKEKKMPNVKKRKIHRTLQSLVGHTLPLGRHQSVECNTLQFSQPKGPAAFCFCKMWLLREIHIGSQC